MPDQELNTLELQIDHFVELHKKATLENTSLRKKVTSLSYERASLLDKKKKIAALLRNLIVQLKDELLCQTHQK
jgi:uncharacterized protein (TIGR02449 family)